jgi:divalent metal cation (Fe/Co/Zn/Cd) transporter
MAAALIAGYEPVAWFSDPIGGILISLYILVRWVGTCHEQFMLLLGQSAERDFLCRLTYLAANFDERILKVDTVIAYRLGAKCHAEVHVVLPADMPLRVAHDIGEALEQNIEKIEDIELAWVHLDFEWSHSAEHRRWDL